MRSIRDAVTDDTFSSQEWQAKAYNLYATFAVVAMQHDTAIEYFNKSLELVPAYINSLLKLDTLFGVKVSSEKGSEYLEKAIALAGDQQADVQFARATMLADSGDMEGAVSLYEKVCTFLFLLIRQANATKSTIDAIDDFFFGLFVRRIDVRYGSISDIAATDARRYLLGDWYAHESGSGDPSFGPSFPRGQRCAINAR